MTRELTDAQRLMVQDGLPPELILTADERRESWKGMRLRPTSSFADPKRPAKDEDPATKALRKELAAAAEKKKAERFARLKMLSDALKASAVKPAAEAATQESDMSKKSTAAAKRVARSKVRHAKGGPKAQPARKARARKAPTDNARTPVINEVVKTIAAMMQRKGGASMEEMVKETGVDPHPMRAKIKQVRDKLGLATEAPSKANGGRYYVRPEGYVAPAAES